MFKVGQKVLVLGKYHHHYLRSMSIGVVVKILTHDRYEVRGNHIKEDREIFQTIYGKDLCPCEFKDYVTKLNKQI